MALLEVLTDAGVPAERAATLLPSVERALAVADPQAAWRVISREILSPELPFSAHLALFRHCYRSWDGAMGPPPAWTPSAEEIAATNLARAGQPDMLAMQRASVEEPERFWGEMIARFAIHFDVPPAAILDASAGPEQARWLVGAQLNIARSALAGDDTRLAVVVGREDGSLRRHALGELRARALEVAAALAAAGIGAGDAVAIDMPMVYESVPIYLGIVARGAVVVSIADSFAPAEIATRLRLSAAKAIFTQDVIARGGKRLPLYERVVKAGAPRAIVLAAGSELEAELRPGDTPYVQFLRGGAGDYERCEAEAATNVLFSSGTTGDPKALLWTHITPLKAAADAFAHHDVRAGDVVCWPTNLGWMMGPWLIYASLLNGATMALYEGAPHDRGFIDFVARAGVTTLGVVPSLVKAWRASGVTDGADLSALRCFSSTGEASSPEEMLWLMSRAGYRPVIEYCGGTEIGGGYVAGSMVQPQAPSSFSTPAVGWRFLILDAEGRPTDEGELALVPPGLGSSNRLLHGDHHAVYFAGMPLGPEGQPLRRHGDEVKHLGGGYYRAQGRVDDTMNLGGIKTSSAEIERAVGRVPGVHETAAVAVEPPEGGPSELVIFAVLREPLAPAVLRAAFSAAIRAQLNPLFKLHDVVVVDALPRTASNKVMRRVLRQQYKGRLP